MIDPNLSAALADRYRLQRELGAGGMATVYLADDVRHGRQVAVKVLRPELAHAMGPERFLREITTTAGLRHPHILPLFDSGDAGGHLFYVMPLVEGESLRDRLEREGQLPMDDALRIAEEVADALGYAHGRGVIHRDVKPENVLLENGHAIVADFGIAQAVRSSDQGKLTMAGMTLGTPAYMSPEQAGGAEVDARSDLYALGCMLYEMLAGEPPFTGSNAMAVIARHLMDPVPNLSTVRPAVGPHVTQAIERVLAKTPADRFASIAEWRQALVPPAASAAAAPPAILKPPPAPATPLLGREDSLTAVTAKLNEGARLLTVTGVGGTGKTRFAIELFNQCRASFPDGAAFVSLASVTAASEVMPTVATALDLTEAHGRTPVDAIATLVGDRRILLLLDNLEQVLDAAGDIAALVARCPALQVVATSRAPLKVGAEVEVPLPPLALPAEGSVEATELLACPSVALFVQRAQRVKPDFALSTANAGAVAAICRRLDGLPLALELAAARVRVLDPAGLLQRLDSALDLLTSGDRDLPMRQRTLRATISWSYSLLDAAEKALLRNLSVFHEGWTLEALEQVCFTEEDRWRAVDLLESLVEKGLVRVVGSGERYALLETIRAFSAEQLHAGGEVDVARRSHAAFFVDFAYQVDRGIRADTQLDAMARARTDQANLNAALAWLIAAARSGDPWALEQGLLLCGFCNWFWHMRGLHMTARHNVDALLELAGDGPPTRARGWARLARAMVSSVTDDIDRGLVAAAGAVADGVALGDAEIVTEGCVYHGYMNLGLGRVDEARPWLERSLAESVAHGHDFMADISRLFMGLCLFVGGDLEGGMALVEQAQRGQLPRGDHEGGGVGLSFLAQMTVAKGDLARAVELYGEAETMLARVGDTPEVARVQCETGWTCLSMPDLDAARLNFQRAVRTYDEVGSARGTGQALMGLAATEAAAGHAELAVRIAAAAQVLSERAGVVVEHAMAPDVTERFEALRASIPQDELAAMVASGGEMSPAEILALVAG